MKTTFYFKKIFFSLSFNRISATPPGQQRSSSAGRQGVSFRERRNVLDASYNSNVNVTNNNNSILSSSGGVVKRQSPHHHVHSHHHHVSREFQQSSQPQLQQSLQNQIPQQHSHAYVNLLHQQDTQFYNNYQNYQHNHNIVNNNSHYYEVGQQQLNTSGSSSLSNNSSMNMSWNNSYGSPNISAYSSR